MRIRSERAGDIPAVREINLSAFESAVEADLVDALRSQAHPLVSLVAEDGGALIGHILFSPMTLSGAAVPIMGLAPMAVRPERQRQGVGTALIRAGLDACRQLGSAAIAVLGHAEYYPRFGFVPASRFGLRCEFEVPDDVFMVLELEEGSLRGRAGVMQYHPAFGAV